MKKKNKHGAISGRTIELICGKISIGVFGRISWEINERISGVVLSEISGYISGGNSGKWTKILCLGNL